MAIKIELLLMPYLGDVNLKYNIIVPLILCVGIVCRCSWCRIPLETQFSTVCNCEHRLL